jgi:hypothetical protein
MDEEGYQLDERPIPRYAMGLPPLLQRSVVANVEADKERLEGTEFSEGQRRLGYRIIRRELDRIRGWYKDNLTDVEVGLHPAKLRTVGLRLSLEKISKDI